MPAGMFRKLLSGWGSFTVALERNNPESPCLGLSSFPSSNFYDLTQIFLLSLSTCFIDRYFNVHRLKTLPTSPARPFRYLDVKHNISERDLWTSFPHLFYFLVRSLQTPSLVLLISHIYQWKVAMTLTWLSSSDCIWGSCSRALSHSWLTCMAVTLPQPFGIHDRLIILKTFFSSYTGTVNPSLLTAACCGHQPSLVL